MVFLIGLNLDLKSKNEKTLMDAAIYADFNGSAPVCEAVRDYLHHRLEEGPYANPNAAHRLGQKVKMMMENARSECASALGASYNHVYFNSGSSEGVSTVFHSVLSDSLESGRNIIITSSIEHPAVLNSAAFYESQGYQVIKTPIKTDGTFDLEALEKTLSEKGEQIALVCLMAAHNETGIIQPFLEISKLCQSHKVLYFSDTTQLIGKDYFNFEESGLDFAITSGHKFGALTGCGILLVKDPSQMKSLIFGGGQERGVRGGTQNYIGYECMAVALKNATKELQNNTQIKSKRIEFETRLKNLFPKFVIIGEHSPRLASTSYVSYPGILGRDVQEELEREEIYVTTSSACCDSKETLSPVLDAMKVTPEVAAGVVRISLCLGCPPELYDRLFDALSRAYKKLS